MTARKKSVDFLPKDRLSKTRLGRIVKRALSAGRYIVLFTELAAIIAFISRFKMDRDLENLHEEISQKQGIVVAYSDLEKEVRFLQKRLAIINQAQNQSLKSSSIIKEITTITPKDVAFEYLEVKGESLSLRGQSLSNSGIATLVKGLEGKSFCQDVNITNVSSEGETNPTLDFEIKVKLTEK